MMPLLITCLFLIFGLQLQAQEPAEVGVRHLQIKEGEHETATVPGIKTFLLRNQKVAKVAPSARPDELIITGQQMGKTRISCELADGSKNVIQLTVVPPYWDTLEYLFSNSPNVEMVVTDNHLILSGEVIRNTVMRKVDSAVKLDPKRIINNVSFSHPDLLRRIDDYLSSEGYTEVKADLVENTVYLSGQIYDKEKRADLLSVVESYAKAAKCELNSAGLKLGGAPLAVEVKFVSLSKGMNNDLGLLMDSVKYNLNWTPKETDVWQFNNHIRSREETASWEMDGNVTNQGSYNLQKIRSGMKVLYETRMATRSGEKATLQQGGTIYKETTGVQVTSTQQVDYGFIVEVTPSMINPNTLSADVSVQVSGLLKEDPLTLDKYKLDAKYTISPGDIIMVNRMNKISDQVTRQSVPYVSEIPMLGNLFTNTKEADEDSNLLLLLRITPLTRQGVGIHGEEAERAFQETKQRRVRLELIEDEERALEE